MSNHITHAMNRFRGRAKAGLVVLAAIACLVGAGLASAASAMTIQVVNDHGLPQAGARILNAQGSFLAWTDNAGRASVTGWSVQAGQTISATRYESGGCGSAPEGPGGASYVIPTPAPPQVTIVVPSTSQLSDPAFEPGLSGSERKLVGMVNDLRRSMELAPLQISTVLSAVADRYLSEVLTHAYDPANPNTFHCIDEIGPTLRAQDAGYPILSPGSFLGVGENGGFGGCAVDPFDSWYQEKGTAESGHYQNMIDPYYRTIGVAYENGVWVTDFGLEIRGGYEAQAGLTNDYGDSSIPDSNSCRNDSENDSDDGSASKPGRRRTPKLRVRHIKVHGHHVSFTVTLPKNAARGQLRVIARSRRSIRGLRVHGSKSVRRVAATLADVGLWRAQIRFVPFDQKHWRRGYASITFRIP